MAKKAQEKSKENSEVNELVDYLRVSLNMMGMQVDYPAAELITETYKVVNKKKGSMSLSDISKLKAEHEQKWNDYYRQQAMEQVNNGELRDQMTQDIPDSEAKLAKDE